MKILNYRTEAPALPEKPNPFWEALKKHDEAITHLRKYGLPFKKMVIESGHGYSVYVAGPADPDVLSGKLQLDQRFFKCWDGYHLTHEWNYYYYKFPHTIKLLKSSKRVKCF